MEGLAWVPLLPPTRASNYPQLGAVSSFTTAQIWQILSPSFTSTAGAPTVFAGPRRFSDGCFRTLFIIPQSDESKLQVLGSACAPDLYHSICFADACNILYCNANSTTSSKRVLMVAAALR